MHKLCLLSLSLVFLLAACGEDDNDTNNATADMAADMTATPDMDTQQDQGGADMAPDAEADLPATPAIEVAGEWDDNFGGMTTITATQWSADAIVEFDNDKNIALIHVAATDMYNPNKFARYAWTEPTDGGFYLCMEVFGKDTLAEAKDDAATSDATDPENAGCGGFSWTKMTAR
jgi:hypothetical protein